MSETLAYLQSKNLHLKYSGDEVRTQCFYHGEDPADRGRLYINVSGDPKSDGAFYCHVCGEKGGLRKLREHFGDPITANAQDDNAFIDWQILQDAADFYADSIDADIAKYLHDERGLTDETIARHQLGYAPGGVALYGHLRDLGYRSKDIIATGLVREHQGGVIDFLQQQITIPYHVNNHVVQIRGKERGGKYLTPPGMKGRLFNTDATHAADEVWVCEGEFDCMVLNQLGFNAVGLPGANSWQENWNGYVADARRVYLCLDPDDAGQKGARKIEDLLGQKSRTLCLPVPPGREPKEIDVTEMVVHLDWTKESFERLRAVANKQSTFLKTIDEAEDEWQQVQGQEGLRFGYELFDTMIRPGLLPGQVMIVLAKTNCVAGDTELVINRGGAGTRLDIATVVDKIVSGAWAPGTTKVQIASPDGTVRSSRIANAWRSGKKFTYTLTTDTGRTIRATAEHPFLQPDWAFRKLGDLRAGDYVMVNAGRSRKGREHRPAYRSRSGLYFHPYAVRRKKYPNSTGWSAQLHRLVVEADMNGLTLESFLDRCKTGPCDDLLFVNPKTHEVHHVDGDRLNNEVSNLRLLTHTEHGAEHARNVSNVLEQVGAERIMAIEPYGEEQTYDIEVEDEPHNFAGNGIFIHNTGKTLCLLNFFQRMSMEDPDRKILFLSLEQTAGDYFERAVRIWNFYNLDVDPTTDAGMADVKRRTKDHWRHRLLIADKNRMTEEHLLTALDDYADQEGQYPDLVAVDYLGYWANGFKAKDRYERVSDAVMSLKAVAKDKRVAIIAPHQVNRGAEFGAEPDVDASRDSGAVEETGDFVCTLWTPDAMKGKNPEERTGLVNLRIGKSRHGGKGTIVRMQFAPLSLVMLPVEDPLCRLAKNELSYALHADTWQQAIRKHRLGVTVPPNPTVNHQTTYFIDPNDR